MNVILKSVKDNFSKFLNPRYYQLLYLIFLAAIKQKRNGKISISGLQLEYNDIRSLVAMYNEIFYQEHFFLSCQSKEPVMIDCGANIGLASLYFKQLYKNAQIVAIEADPDIARILSTNFDTNRLSGEIIQKAVWTNDNMTINFGQSGSDAGSILATENVISVPTIRLKSLLESYEKIDFLKMDIEGAEFEVILDCAQALQRVDYLFVEFHSFPHKPQGLEAILATCVENGFRYQILPARREKRPFFNADKTHHMDVQLNVFFFRS